MNCKNCNASLSQSTNYCLNCGAKIIRNRLTIRNLFAHFSEEFLIYDNKFLQTFIHLFTKPEEVINGYIKGTRKKYVNVISYFAIAITIAGIELFLLNKFYPEAMTLLTFGNVPEGFSRKTMELIFEYQSIMLMLVIPFYAIISKLVFLKKRKFNYTEHLVIFMYVLAQLSIFGAIYTLVFVAFGIGFGDLSYISILIQVVYTAYCLKRLYGLSLKGIILRTLLFLGVILIMYILSMVLFMVYVLIAKPAWLNEFIEAQKAAQQVMLLVVRQLPLA